MTLSVSDTAASPSPATQRSVALFATCLVDLMRPSVGFAAVHLLEKAGCHVDVPEAQTCCGQPAFNSGDTKDAREIAVQVIQTFEPYDYIVVPSGSCGGMISHHYVDMFKEDATWGPRAQALAAKTHELLSFLTDVCGVTDFGAAWAGRATYHDSCSGLRELGIKTQPRDLMSKVDGLTLIEGENAETCCGFGGLFCVKYPDISETMVDKKVDDILKTDADLLLAGDLGCLMNMAGRLRRRGKSMDVRHLAEVLAGDMEATAGIGAAEPDARNRRGSGGSNI